MFKEVLLPLPSWPERLSDEALTAAVAAARSLDAELVALGFDLAFHAPSSPLANVLLDVRGMIAETRTQARANAQAMAAILASAAASAGVRARTRSLGCESGEVYGRTAEIARLHDLTIVAWSESDADRIYLAETVLFGSGRPVLVLPRPDAAARTGFRRIAVAWDGGPQAARAIGDALPLLRAAEEVRVLTVQGEKPIPDTNPVEEVVRHLAAHGVAAGADRLDAGGRRIGEVIAAHARDRNADLLVMGAFGRSRLREMVLGGATQSMLEQPPLPILISH